jgi:hypothetical protein
VEENAHWVNWHDDYDDPTSSLSQRLRVVQRRLSDALDAVPEGEFSLISACAGEGRDVIPVLASHRRRTDAQALLVEFDPTLVANARAAAEKSGLTNVVVTRGDASTTSAFSTRVPAHVALFCGIFGNISDEDVRDTISLLPSLLAPTATVIWTRHTVPPDLTVAIRRWFIEAGFEEVGFDSEAGRFYGVGAHVLARPPDEFVPDRRMFTFIGDGSGAAL